MVMHVHLTRGVWIEWYRMMKPTPGGQMFKGREEVLRGARDSWHHA